MARKLQEQPAPTEEEHVPGTPVRLRLTPGLVLAPDARLTSAQLGAVLDAAWAAGARSVRLVGMQLSAERLQLLEDHEPLFAAYARGMAPRMSGGLALLSAVPRGAPVYLALGGKDMTALDVVRAAEQVERAFPEQPVVLITGAPGQPWQPPAAEARGEGSPEASESLALTGHLSKEAIQGVVRRHKAQVRYCYESALARKPKLAGKVVVNFTIVASGTVTAAELGQGTLEDADLERCLLTRVRRWRFPTFQGDEVRVSYPFTFSPAAP